MTVLEIMEMLARENNQGGDLIDLPCPFCQRPRSQRSDYIRCQPCGVNWLQEEMHLPNYLSRDPRLSREEAARMARPIKPSAAQSEAAAR